MYHASPKNEDNIQGPVKFGWAIFNGHNFQGIWDPDLRQPCHLQHVERIVMCRYLSILCYESTTNNGELCPYASSLVLCSFDKNACLMAVPTLQNPQLYLS